MCQDPKKIRDPGSAGSKIWDLEGSWILHFHFCREILQILDLVVPILPQDPRDLGSQTEKNARDPEDPGSCLSNVARDPVDLGFCTAIMLLYLDILMLNV